jgi:predicted dehydrogenase
MTNGHDRRAFLRASAGAGAALALSELLEALPVSRTAPLDVALVGCGRQGRAILTELGKLPDVRVVGLCDVSEGRLKSAQRRAAQAQIFTKREELFAKCPGAAVIVATPTHVHREAAVEALAAGRHVYVESPLASSLEDARAIVTASRGAKGICAVGALARSNPVYALARSFLKSGAVRDVVSMRAQWHKKTSWRATAANPEEERAANWMLDPEVSLGLAGELGAHAFDTVDWFLGATPESVRASGSLQLHADGRKMPDTIALDLVYPGGVRLAYDATLANSFEGQYELFHGSMGTIKLAQNAGWLFKEADAPTQGWEVYANREAFHDEQGITLIADATKLAKLDKLKEGVGLPESPLYYALADFVRAATEGRAPACTAADGLRVAAIAIAASRAVASGGMLAIEAESLAVPEAK